MVLHFQIHEVAKQADYEKNIDSGEVYLFMESLTQPRVIMDDATRSKSLAGWLASKHYGYKDEAAADLETKLKDRRSGVDYLSGRYISFLSRSYPDIQDPILPDDPRYDAHIIKRPWANEFENKELIRWRA